MATFIRRLIKKVVLKNTEFSINYNPILRIKSDETFEHQHEIRYMHEETPILNVPILTCDGSTLTFLLIVCLTPHFPLHHNECERCKKCPLQKK